LGGLAVWPPDAQALSLKEVHDAQSQRMVRPDHRKIDLEVFRQGEQAGQVFRRDGGAPHRGPVGGQLLGGDAGVARRAPKARHARGLRQFPHQRVLAPAGTNDQDSHGGEFKQEEGTLASMCFTKKRRSAFEPRICRKRA